MRQSDDADTDFYLLYALIPLAELVKPRSTSNGHEEVATVFATDEHPGRTRITMPLGAYSQWLVGKDAAKPKKSSEWLVGDLGLRVSKKITPDPPGPNARAPSSSPASSLCRLNRPRHSSFHSAAARRGPRNSPCQNGSPTGAVRRTTHS